MVIIIIIITQIKLSFAVRVQIDRLLNCHIVTTLDCHNIGLLLQILEECVICNFLLRVICDVDGYCPLELMAIRSCSYDHFLLLPATMASTQLVYNVESRCVMFA